jgi:molybdate transport repressor ModE-like protein
MKLNQLRALIAVSEKGSIHEAARHLHISQPALSKTIQELEASVDTKLVERSSGGTRLTLFGERLVEHARLIMENVNLALTDIHIMKGFVGGEITMGATPLASAMAPLAAVLGTFNRAYPDVRLRLLEMRSSQLRDQLQQGTIDFAVMTEWTSEERSYEATELGRRASVIAARRDHPLRAAETLIDLQRAEWLTCDPLSDTTSSFCRLFSGNELALPLRVIECTSVLLALELCVRSDKLLVLSTESLASPVVTEKITYININETLPEQSIHLVRHRRQVLSRPAEILAQEILSGFREDARQRGSP